MKELAEKLCAFLCAKYYVFLVLLDGPYMKWKKLCLMLSFAGYFPNKELISYDGFMRAVFYLRFFPYSFDFARVGLCLAVVIDAYKKDIASVF